jgi:glycosyltransferase involved in cell wall biosynthesis
MARLEATPTGRRETAPTVMQVTPNLAIGGAQETVRTLAKYLPRAGYPVVVCSFDDGPLREEIARLEVPIELLPTRRHSIVSLPSFVIEMLRMRRRLLALIATHRVGIVQTQGLGTLDFLVMTLRFGHRVQVWWTIQNQHFEVRAEHLIRHRWLLRPKRLAHRSLYLLGTRLVDGVIAVSDETARSFRDAVGYRGDKLHVVFNAVDVERYPAAIDRDEVRARLGFGPGDHVMTMVGTFKRQKGHRYLVEAAARVIPRYPRLHLLLVGDGTLADETRERIEASGLAGRVHLVGTRSDVPQLLAASDSFVLPSLWEGLPVALVEAMASRLPVIATEVSGTSQVMVDGETGWLVPPGDPAALSRAMAELLSNPAHAAAMAAAGCERVAASFGARTQAERLVALFGGHDIPQDPTASATDDEVRVS